MSCPTVDEFREFFVEEYEQQADSIEETDVIPEGLLRRAAELGAYRLTIPEEYGGWGLTVPDYLPYLEAAAGGQGSGRMLVHLTNGVWRPVLQFGRTEQRELVRAIASGDTVVAFCLDRVGRRHWA